MKYAFIEFVREKDCQYAYKVIEKVQKKKERN